MFVLLSLSRRSSSSLSRTMNCRIDNATLSSAPRLGSLADILFRLCIELPFASLRTEIVGFVVIFGCASGGLLINLHSADWIALVAITFSFPFVAQLGFRASLARFRWTCRSWLWRRCLHEQRAINELSERVAKVESPYTQGLLHGNSLLFRRSRTGSVTFSRSSFMGCSLPYRYSRGMSCLLCASHVSKVCSSGLSSRLNSRLRAPQ